MYSQLVIIAKLNLIGFMVTGLQYSVLQVIYQKCYNLYTYTTYQINN